jgi:hypothetical protein
VHASGRREASGGVQDDDLRTVQIDPVDGLHGPLDDSRGHALGRKIRGSERHRGCDRRAYEGGECLAHRDPVPGTLAR